MKARGETFKSQRGPINCNLENLLHLWSVNCVVTFLMLEKPKLSFSISSIAKKTKHRAFKRTNRTILQKFFQKHHCFDGHLGIGHWDFTLLEQYKTHKQLKKRQAFWQNQIKRRVLYINIPRLWELCVNTYLVILHLRKQDKKPLLWFNVCFFT